MSSNDEPNLDEPGLPISLPLTLEDGKQVFHEIPQTKRDNCIALAEEAGSEENVTREMVEAHPVVTWRDFNYWIMELLEHQKGRDFYWDMAQKFEGQFDLPETYLDELGLRHLEE